MCLGGSGGGLAPETPDLPDQPSKREKTAQEVRRPEGQLERQRVGAQLGVAQLMAPLLNAPK